MTGCTICKNPFNRKAYDRMVRLGYACDLQSAIGQDVLWRVLGRHGADNQIGVCTQCRYDLMGVLRRWIGGEFVESATRASYEALYRDCPCCGFDTTQDGRGLRISGIPGLEILHENFRVVDSVAILITCQDCRGEFIRTVLVGWLTGKFIADAREVNQVTRDRIRFRGDSLTNRSQWPPRIQSKERSSNAFS